MKYLIVEDERFAYAEVKRMLTNLRNDYSLEKQTKTVIDTIDILKTSAVDLILMDIRLADCNCFEVFNNIEVTTPVIFTTAYDEHAIRAFKLNSIDYLLKPFNENELEAALTRFEHIFHSDPNKGKHKNYEQLLSVRTKNQDRKSIRLYSSQ